MFDMLKDYWWLIVTVLTILTFIINIAFKVAGLYRRIDYLEKRSKQERMDICTLLDANFAVLDGLIELGCDGKVKAARDKLSDYVCNLH